MKAKPTNQTNFYEQGRREFERTSEFRKKVEEIKKEISAKYSMLISSEKNLIRRFLLRIKMDLEIRNRVKEISSNENLHLIKS